MNFQACCLRRLITGKFPVLWFLLAGVSGPARGTDLIDQWVAAQTNLHTWSAQVVETRNIRTFSQPLVSTGQVWVAIPDHFRWELGRPPQTIAVRQPAELTIVYPRLKRVEQYPLQGETTGPWKDALALLDASFPQSRAKLEAQFQILSVTQTNGIATLALQPRSSAARKFIARVQIGFHTGDFSPASAELTFSDGSSLHNEFDHGQANPALDPSLFSPKIEPDFTVVQPVK